ncbi:MAG: aminotransferase class V-fold PLP-dependent enzyme, partial [Planctomycetota bacterium]
MNADLASLARSQFPALDRGTIFLDNAGGSQIPIQAIDAVQRHFLECYSQFGGEYPQSMRAAQTVKAAHRVVKAYLNGGTPTPNRPAGFELGQGSGDVILGSSSTALIHLIAGAYADAHQKQPGRNRIIIRTAAHEANVWPWGKIEPRGFEIVPWHCEPPASGPRSALRPNIATLKSL